MSSICLFNGALCSAAKMKYFSAKHTCICLAPCWYGFVWQTVLHLMLGLLPGSFSTTIFGKFRGVAFLTVLVELHVIEALRFKLRFAETKVLQSTVALLMVSFSRYRPGMRLSAVPRCLFRVASFLR